MASFHLTSSLLFECSIFIIFLVSAAGIYINVDYSVGVVCDLCQAADTDLEGQLRFPAGQGL